MKAKRRQITITNKRVDDEFNSLGKGRVSKFIEECVLYYLDSVENGYVTKDQVKGIVLDCLKDIPIYSGEISNPNYTNNVDQLKDDVLEILGL